MRPRKLKTISTEANDRYRIKIQSSKNIYSPPSQQKKQSRGKKAADETAIGEKAILDPIGEKVKLDSIDNIIAKIDQKDNDKYRTASIENDLSTLSSHPTDTEQPPSLLSGLSGLPSEATSKSESNVSGSHISLLSSGYTSDGHISAEYGVFSGSSEEIIKVQPRNVNELYQMIDEEDDKGYRLVQRFSYLSIIILSFQTLILFLQLSLCGLAPLDVNPLIGVFPDTISDWGGKNPFLIKQGEWWRLITPAFLHVGVLQLLVNGAIHLHTCAFFEREWGSFSFLWVYIISEIGCIIVSCCMNPDSLAVGSSGAIMGLFGAKLAQVAAQVCFEINEKKGEEVRLEQLSSMLCSMSIILTVSFFTYIDYSGHMGALGAGFIVGMICFSRSIRSGCSRNMWRLLGIVLLFTFLTASFYIFIYIIEPDEDLAYPCEYFRNLYNEAHECECYI